MTSSSPEFQLKLTENVYFHNSYVARYLHFQKLTPPKNSVEIDTFYVAKGSLGTASKYSKDVSVLLAKVFVQCSLCLLLDKEPKFPLTKLEPKSSKVQVATYSDLFPLNLTEIPSEDAFDLYEYLCLLHMNSIPDPSDERTRVCNMYEVPKGESEVENQGELWLHNVTNTTPNALRHLVSSEHWISVFARTKNHNIVIKRATNGNYIWHVYS